MLQRLLGRDRSSSAPKNQIEVVCPVCGAAQFEPRLVVTTFCRKCNEHLRIVGRRVLASSKLNPVPSAVFPTESSSRLKIMGQLPPPAHSPRPEEPAPQPSALLPTEPLRVEQTLPGFGNMMMGVEGEPTNSIRAETQEPERRVMPEKASEAPVAPGPITVSTFQKMKEQGYYRQQYFKDVECFDCHHKFKVGRSAKSTQCPTCGVHICLEDLDINMASTQPILTRGDVMVRKNGNISTSQIMCRDLKVFGMVSGQIECSGDLLLRTSGTIIGEIRCKRFIVEKGSELKFHNVVYADDVEIHARVVGNIQCSGRVLIGAQGWIHGDVTARSVSIEPGGQLDGAMNILRSTPQKQPAAPLPQASPEKSELVS